MEFMSFRPQVVPAQVDPALNQKSIRPHLKLNTFELKYTSVYHFKMFLLDFNFKNSNIRIFLCVIKKSMYSLNKYIYYN